MAGLSSKTRSTLLRESFLAYPDWKVGSHNPMSSLHTYPEFRVGIALLISSCTPVQLSSYWLYSWFWCHLFGMSRFSWIHSLIEFGGVQCAKSEEEKMLTKM